MSYVNCILLDFHTFISAKISPLDHVLHPGESFTINCTLKSSVLSSVDPALLYFQHRPLDGGNTTRVATKSHTVVGNGTMQIHMTAVQLSDAGNYTCHHPKANHPKNRASLPFTKVQIGGNILSCEYSDDTRRIATPCSADYEYMGP